MTVVSHDAVRFDMDEEDEKSATDGAAGTETDTVKLRAGIPLLRKCNKRQLSELFKQVGELSLECNLSTDVHYLLCRSLIILVSINIIRT